MYDLFILYVVEPAVTSVALIPIDTATTEVSVIGGPLKIINLVSLGICFPSLGSNSKVSPETSSVNVSVIFAKWCMSALSE